MGWAWPALLDVEHCRVGSSRGLERGARRRSRNGRPLTFGLPWQPRCRSCAARHSCRLASMPSWRTIWIALVMFVGAEGLARADGDPVEACIAAAERGQELASAGRPRAASDHFSRCVRTECPQTVRRDCLRFAAEADAAMATLTVNVVDARSTPLNGVRLFVDGLVAETLEDAHTIRLDPGSHVIEAVTVNGRASSTVQLVAGERGRSIELQVRAETVQTHRPVPDMVWIVGIVGLVGLATFGVMGTLGASEVHDVRARCAPRCAEGELSPATTKLIVADAALLGGVLALSVSTWLYLKRPAVPVTF